MALLKFLRKKKKVTDKLSKPHGLVTDETYKAPQYRTLKEKFGTAIVSEGMAELRYGDPTRGIGKQFTEYQKKLKKKTGKKHVFDL